MSFRHDSSFLEMIRADLDDDAPRLVYADFLQQKGARYGELITASCALAAKEQLPLEKYGAFTELRPIRSADHPQPEEVERLTARVRDLLKKNGAAWEEEVRTALTPREIEWRRGFIERVSIEADRLTTRLFDVAPCLTAVDVHASLGSELEPIVDSPVMQCPQMKRLRIGWGLAATAPKAREIQEPNALRSLALPDVWLSVSVLAELVARPSLSAIEELSVFGARGHDGVIVRSREVVAVLRSASSRAIKRLNVGHAQLGSEGFKALRALSWFRNLEVLNARDTEINDDDVMEILEALSPTLVVALDLSGNLLRDETARALADWSGTLLHLDLRGNVMTEGAREELRAVYRDRALL